MFSHELEGKKIHLAIEHLELNLNACQMGDSGLSRICEIVEFLPLLRVLSLDLVKNSIGEEGVKKY